MGDDDFSYTNYALDDITCDVGPIEITVTDENLVGTSIFTKYPDLESKSVKEGLGVDVVEGLRKIINDSQ